MIRRADRAANAEPIIHVRGHFLVGLILRWRIGQRRAIVCAIVLSGKDVVMAVQLKPLNEQVIVITGASSGIGLTTARMAARQGAKIVATARNEAGLRELVDGITNAGGQAVHVVADVGN